MSRFLSLLLVGVTKFYTDFRGEGQLRIVEVNANPLDAYRFVTATGGDIVLSCTETVYEMSYARWWARDRRYVSYSVSGQCDESIPVVFAGHITRGFHIGPLLPSTAARHAQKKAAIHSFISLIKHELQQQTTRVSS